MISLILRKSAKSLQIKLNEFFEHESENTVSASAYTQARANLKHTAFIELNEGAFIDPVYSDGDYKRYKGFRLLAVDGSKLRLPDTKDIREEFGTIRIKSQHIEGLYTGAQSSVLYDVLNDVLVDSIIAPGKTSELSLAKEHLRKVTSEDLILFDRGYPGYELFAEILKKNANFVCRCSKTAFGEVKNFLAESTQEDTVVTLYPQRELKKSIVELGLPSFLRIRLVKVVLSTGEIEILATSLLDPAKYLLEDFKELYAMRWQVETLFDRLKNRLALENFTGKTAKAVKQDFYATVLITNMESAIAGEVDDEFIKAETPQQVNKSVSFNAIMHAAYDIAACQYSEVEDIVENLQNLFLKGTNYVRKNRIVPRKKTPVRRSLNFQQRLRKFVF